MLWTIAAIAAAGNGPYRVKSKAPGYAGGLLLAGLTGESSRSYRLAAIDSPVKPANDKIKACKVILSVISLLYLVNASLVFQHNREAEPYNAQ